MHLKLLNFLLVAVGLFAGPGVIFILPYFIVQESYAAFAKLLTFSQIIILMGGAGLDIGCPRLKVPILIATAILTIITMSAALILFAVSGPLTLTEYGIVLCAGLFGALSAMYQSYFLFRGDAITYGLSGLSRSLVTLICLFVLLNFGNDASISWGVATFAGFFASLYFVKKLYFDKIEEEKTPIQGWVNILKLSLPFFFINGAAVLPFILDRFMSQRYMTNGDFARYMVVTTWAIPIVYIGNIYQQYLIANFDIDSRKILIKSFLTLFGAGAVYILLVTVLTKTYIAIPYFKDSEDFLLVWILVGGWFALYGAMAFPAAAHVQKNMRENIALSLSRWTAFVLPLALTASFFAARFWWAKIGIYAGVIFSASFAFLMLTPRVYFVWRSLSKNPP